MNNAINNASIIDLSAVQVQATDLRSSGILVTCLMHGSTLSITDRAASDDLARDKGADRKSIAVQKKLAESVTELKNLNNLKGTMYNGLNRLTYDFAGDARYLPAGRFEEFAQWWSDLLKEHADRKQKFLDAWPTAIANAAFAASGLGQLFNRNDYPTVEELERKFYVELIQSEVPVGDFRNVLFHEALGDARARLQQHVDQTVKQMLNTQAQQLRAVMESLAHACTLDYEDTPEGKKVRRNPLREATVEKALALCRTFEQFNPAGSAELEAVRQALASTLTAMPYEVLRTSDSAREQVKEEIDAVRPQVDALLDKFSL
jgi:hypothetical protein